jgi:uncharacterized protein (DUF1330 family)
MTYTLIVGIGRNVPGGGPLNWLEWGEFRTRVTAAIRESGHTPLFRGEGIGEWEGEYEDSYTVVALPDGDEANLDALKVALEELRKTYRQEAIAVTVGSTTLVG